MPDEQTNSQAPWWDQTIMKIGSTFGVPTLLLGYFLSQNAGVIPNPIEKELEDMRSEMQELKGAVIQQGGAMKEIAVQLAKEVENKQRRCVMRAKTDSEKQACFPNKE